MNEIIKKLANQANVTFDWDPGTSGPEVYFDRQEDFEKFIQLLINECAETIRKDLKRFPEEDLTWRCAMEESARVVEQNFGITMDSDSAQPEKCNESCPKFNSIVEEMEFRLAQSEKKYGLKRWS